jgi:plasmid maintenance system antidote protein VapI
MSNEVSEFEAEFIVSMHRLQMSKKQVAEKLKCTYPTLNSKIKDYRRITIGDLLVLRKMGFDLPALIKTFKEL